MERRRFLQLMSLVAGALALNEVIPFNRVWSFPTGKIRIANLQEIQTIVMKSRQLGMSDLIWKEYLRRNRPRYIRYADRPIDIHEVVQGTLPAPKGFVLS
jgi:hypothetical protein